MSDATLSNVATPKNLLRREVENQPDFTEVGLETTHACIVEGPPLCLVV